jgi:hypothetical protein
VGGSGPPPALAVPQFLQHITRRPPPPLRNLEAAHRIRERSA